MLRALMADGFAGDPAGFSFCADAKVPMYLDGWDKYGFRFYYRPWETPAGSRWKDYNVLDEFDFAKRLGGLGFVFWAKPDETDTGPGLTNKHWWDWAARAARRRDLPIVVNTVRSTPTWLLNAYRDQVMAKMADQPLDRVPRDAYRSAQGIGKRRGDSLLHAGRGSADVPGY